MKNLSIRWKITLWFAAVLVVTVALTFAVVFSVSGSVMQKTIQDTLIDTVANNVDEVEFFGSLDTVEKDNDADQYIEYNGGHLEIDDDYLDLVNGVSTSLYLEDGTLLYGENPIARETAGYRFADGQLQKVPSNGVTYYLYDAMLTQRGLDGLWLRGVVSEEQGSAQLSSIVRLSLYLFPLLAALAVFGGYIIAGRTLKPIRDIEDAAIHIGKGRDLKKRIELSPGTDELHRLAATFNEMFGRLEESFESERQFTSDVSHELRTPMSVIMAQCEYTLERVRTPEEYEAALRLIRRQGGRMSRLIEDMLCFARLEQGSGSYVRERIDLSRLARSVCEDMALIKERGISLSSDIADGVFVAGNRELLSRLLTNLISNAYRYGRDGGYIRVTLAQEKGGVTLSVRDNGIGIAPEDREKIFNRFYQVEASRTGAGTGLGLSMVQEIARFHGGTVSVESEPGEGSVFTLTLEKSKP